MHACDDGRTPRRPLDRLWRALGALIAPPFARWFARAGFAPAGFTAHFILWSVATAFGIGLLIALTGAWLAARRAGRVRPAEALREASVDRKAMTLSRWIVGLAALAGCVPLTAVFATARTADAKTLILLIAMLLILGCGMLTPVLIAPLARLLTKPLAALLGPAGLLAAHGAAAAVRRTAATATPVLLTVGLAGALLAGIDTFNGTAQAATRARITAPSLVTPAGGGGVADRAAAAIGAVPGVTAAVPVADTNVYVRSGGDPDEWAGSTSRGPASPARSTCRWWPAA